jgi:hypothetical protein
MLGPSVNNKDRYRDLNRLPVGRSLLPLPESAAAVQIVVLENPPSTTIFCPVTKELARELANQITAPASSSGLPNLAIGV